MAGYILLGVAAVLIVVLISIYNGMVGKKNQVANVFGTIDALLKKRYDLIPNLVETARQYMKYEQETLTQITALRARATSGKLSDDEHVEMDNTLSKLIGGIMVAVEKYPELKANENMMHLQRTLTEVEEQLSAARRAYNAAVTDYNNACEMIPTNFVASMMGYKTKRLFEVSEKEREPVSVGDLFSK